MKPKRAERIQDPYNLTKLDAAQFLGIKVTTVDRWVMDRKLPHIKLNGRLVRFRMSDLIQFAEKQRVA